MCRDEDIMRLIADALEHETSTIPEKKLLCAMLCRAWQDLDEKNYMIQDHALAYLEGRPYKGEPTDGDFSFVNVCEALNLNPNKLRRLMLRTSYLEATAKEGSLTRQHLKHLKYTVYRKRFSC